MVLFSICEIEEIVFLLSKFVMAFLIRGNELELVVFVGTVLGEFVVLVIYYVLELLARKCMMILTW